VEELGYIEIKIEGIVENHPLKPKDVDIAEIKELISDIEVFLYPERSDRASRPHISYKIEEGSAKHLFYLPITSVILFNGLIGEISNRNSVEFLEYKRAQVIDKFQRIAKERNFEITFTDSIANSNVLKITKTTSYFNPTAAYIETEFTLYGKINEEGGKNPNFHIITKEYGKLIVSATEKQLLEGEKRLFKVYGIRAKGKLSLVDKKPYDLKLISYIEYSPAFNKSELDLLIERASIKLSLIKNVDTWINDLRGGSIG
jgi:hypothetical protein